MTKIKRSCKVEECCNWAVSNGLCAKHLKRWQRHGHTNSTRANDWGSRESHPLYGIWTWRRRKCTGTLCLEWREDFWRFVSDVGESPGVGFKLQRIDKTIPYSEDNFEWAEKRVTKQRSETKQAYARRYQRAYRKSENGKRALKDGSLKKQYGITLMAYEAILKSQNNVCAICSMSETSHHHITKEIRDLAVDHCHTTGKVRGLLCSKCNTGLGSFKDSRKLLSAATDYLTSRY